MGSRFVRVPIRPMKPRPEVSSKSDSDKSRAGNTGVQPRAAYLSRRFFDLVVEDYKISKKRSLDDLEYRIDKNLRKTFGTVRASMFSSTHVDNHIRSRRSAGASDATINREPAIVRRAFSLGIRTDPPLVNRKPWNPFG